MVYAIVSIILPQKVKLGQSYHYHNHETVSQWKHHWWLHSSGDLVYSLCSLLTYSLYFISFGQYYCVTNASIICQIKWYHTIPYHLIHFMLCQDSEIDLLYFFLFWKQLFIFVVQDVCSPACWEIRLSVCCLWKDSLFAFTQTLINDIFQIESRIIACKLE